MIFLQSQRAEANRKPSQSQTSSHNSERYEVCCAVNDKTSEKTYLFKDLRMSTRYRMLPYELCMKHLKHIKWEGLGESRLTFEADEDLSQEYQFWHHKRLTAQFENLMAEQLIWLSARARLEWVGRVIALVSCFNSILHNTWHRVK